MTSQETTRNVSTLRRVSSARKLSFAVFLFFAASISSGYGEILDKTLMHESIPREYTLYIPSGYTPDNSTALVVNLHGYNRTSDDQMQISGMNSVAEQEGFIVVYPNAVNAAWTWRWERNIRFIDALVDAISLDYTIDQSRLYATGSSLGGIMSYVLGVERSDKFAAVASVAGTRWFDSQEILFPPEAPSVPQRPLPLLHIHGTADGKIPYAGGEGSFGLEYQAAEDAIGQWIANNGGSEVPTVTRLPDVDPNDGTTVDLFSCSDCDSYVGVSGEQRVAEVLLYRINDGGHNWPGDFTPWPADSLPVSYDISGSTEIWDFFSRHELPATAMPAAGDFNHDGHIDGRDFLNWQRGESPNPLSPADLVDWQAGFGTDATSLHDPTSLAPEPTTLFLLFLATFVPWLGRFSGYDRSRPRTRRDRAPRGKRGFSQLRRRVFGF